MFIIDNENISLTKKDRDMLSGKHSKSTQFAMKTIVRMAKIQQAQSLIDITHVHIGGSIYTGEASLNIIESLANEGVKVVVPTTINAISVDRRTWDEKNDTNIFNINANRLAKAFEKMGAQPMFSCIPYIYPSKPKLNDDIVWAESNAIAYANSVLGARTNRHGDFMDICAAITGRAPKAGLHIEENRKGTILFEVPDIKYNDTSLFTALGYFIGKQSSEEIPVIAGLKSKPSLEELKAFSAAASTAGPIGLFHMVGITPEATTINNAFGGLPIPDAHKITIKELEETIDKLSTDNGKNLDLIVMGSPHYTLEEFHELIELISEEKIHENVEMWITTNMYVFNEAKNLGYIDKLELFGAKIITDMCLCMLNEKVIGVDNDCIMTNSGKFAHYGPGLVNRNITFSNTKDCVDSAILGKKIKTNLLSKL